MFTKKAPAPVWSLPKKILIGTIAGGCMGYNPVKNVLGSDYFVKKSSFISEDNKIVTLPLEIHEFADDVRKDIRLKPESRERIKFFYSKGLDPTHVGNLNLVGSTRIGIPYTLHLEKVEDVDPNMISSIIGKGKLRSEDWFKTEKGKKLMESLVLTEAGRKFAIAREIVAADSEIVYYRDVLAGAIVFAAVASYEYLQTRTASLIGKWPSILIFSFMMTVIYVTSFTVALEWACHVCTMMDDQRVLQYARADYRKGAPEYYEKLIERNKLLRGLLIDGPERFDSDGNPIPWYQVNFNSLKDRLDGCRKVIDTWKEDTTII